MAAEFWLNHTMWTVKDYPCSQIRRTPACGIFLAPEDGDGTGVARPVFRQKKILFFFPKHPHLQDLNNLRCCKDAVASSHSLLPCAHRGLNVHVGK